MLGLFARKSDHPLADPKSAAELMKSLPGNDGLKALQELTDWLDSVRSDAGFRLDERFAAVRLLDEHARPHKRKLTRELYSSPSLSGFRQNRLWTSLHEFITQLAGAYGEVLVGCRNGDKGVAALKPLQPLIATRAVHAARGRLKCAVARYAEAADDVWAQLAQGYAQAENGGYLDETIALYPGMHSDSSVRNEFAGALLWWMSGSGTLKPQQAHLAERLTMHLSRHLTVEAQPVDGSLLCFNLERPGPPARLTGKTASQGTLRYIGLGQARKHLESLIATLEKGIVPDAINLGGSYDVESLLDVANRLSGFWVLPQPVRRSPRRSIHVSLEVAGGFSRMVEADHGFDRHELVHWEAEEISTNGFRCILAAGQEDAVRIGMLIGMRPENVDHWGAGIVRRLVRDAQDRLHAGVELLSSQVQVVMLGEANHSGMGREQAALLLKRNADTVDEVRLLVPLDVFSVNRTLLMRAAGRRYLLMPLELLERGEDYDLARYRCIEQDAVGEDAA